MIRPPLFPRDTHTWASLDVSTFRAFSRSIVGPAAVTGVALRLFRALVLTSGPVASWLYLGGAFAAGAAFLFGILTLHLANYPVRRWFWHVAAFAALAAAAEMATSALLIALAREPLGTGEAHWHDWPGLAVRTLVERVLALGLFALVLAAVVQLVRWTLVRRRRHYHHAVPRS